MLTEKKEQNRAQVEITSPDLMVPGDHLLRKIDAAVNFDHIYTLVRDLYCADNGRPSVDPVVLFKLVLLQHLYGIPSLRRTVAEAEMNVAYRWFLGYGLMERIPHFATVSYAFRNRFDTETVEGIFEWILREIEKAGYLSPEVVYVDGTHIKANANLKKQVKKEIPKAARAYEKELREEVNKDREAHGKKPFDDDDDPPMGTKEITESKTDPESGLFHKGEHKRCFAYGAQTMCDDHNYILGVMVNPGNLHDSVTFDALYDKVRKRFPGIEFLAADAAYKTPHICKKLMDDQVTPSLPYTRPQTKKGFFPAYEYVYDEYYDCYLCPNNKVLTYRTTNRDGYREYKSDPKDCKVCPFRERCTQSQNCQKVVQRHVWQDYLEEAEHLRHMPEIKSIYERRKETIERCFADAKEKHGMRYTLYRGLAAVTKWVLLKFTAMNLKKYAIRKWRERRSPLRSLLSDLFSWISTVVYMYTKNPITVC